MAAAANPPYRVSQWCDLVTEKGPIGVSKAILYFHGYIRISLKVVAAQRKLQEKNA